jgi:DNA (cytosine-5)-methyltransferase 1
LTTFAPPAPTTRDSRDASRPPSGRIALSLFSGAGGLDLGLDRAGWSVVAQIEMDRDSADTLRRRAADRDSGDALRRHVMDRSPRVLAERIEAVVPRDLRESLGLEPGELTLLAGGPPCQPFTTSGLRRALTDRRASSLFPAYLEFVREFAPRALLIENVDGMLSAALQHRSLAHRGADFPPLGINERKGSFLRWLVTELAQLGYALAWGVVEAADYGVPQLRQRAILIGVKGARPCFLPPPTHGREGFPDYVTLREALAETRELGPVQPLSERKRRVYALVPPGGNWRSLSPELQRETMGAAFNAEGGKSGWWRRLSWDAPAPTILGMPDHSSTALVHPDEIRCLSLYECAAAQSFPPGSRFSGRPRSQYQQVGNAVPPKLGEALGRHLGRFLDGERFGPPPTPPWRRISANRRIGTHGWASHDDGLKVTINGAVRPDHVWHYVQDVVQCPHSISTPPSQRYAASAAYRPIPGQTTIGYSTL